MLKAAQKAAEKEANAIFEMAQAAKTRSAAFQSILTCFRQAREMQSKLHEVQDWLRRFDYAWSSIAEKDRAAFKKELHMPFEFISAHRAAVNQALFNPSCEGGVVALVTLLEEAALIETATPIPTKKAA